MNKEKEFYASASSIKLIQNCTLKYYYSKILRIPEVTNQGALAGSVVHFVLECLIKERRKKAVKKIIKNNKLSDSVKYLIYKKGLTTGVSIDKIPDAEKMVLAALQLDFYAKGGEIIGSEVEFNLSGEGYKIRGFMDVVVKYKNLIVVKDYKSSKKLFVGKDWDENIQGLMYSLAASKLYPELQNEVDFLMLKFVDEMPHQVYKATKERLIEFEKELAVIYKKMKDFGAEDRFDNVAASKGFPTDGTFSGRLQCGFSTRKGELKKDGSVKYACPFRFQFFYYKLLEKDGATLVATSLDKKSLQKDLKDGRIIVKGEHLGCESFLK